MSRPTLDQTLALIAAPGVMGVPSAWLRACRRQAAFDVGKRLPQDPDDAIAQIGLHGAVIEGLGEGAADDGQAFIDLGIGGLHPAQRELHHQESGDVLQGEKPRLDVEIVRHPRDARPGPKGAP